MGKKNTKLSFLGLLYLKEPYDIYPGADGRKSSDFKDYETFYFFDSSANPLEPDVYFVYDSRFDSIDSITLSGNTLKEIFL